MGCRVQGLNLVRVVGENLPKSAPIIAISFLCESHHKSRHRDDAMFSEQTDRLTINSLGTAFANSLERGLVRALDAEKEPGNAGFFVEVKDVSVAHDIAGPGRANKNQGYSLGYESLQERLPGRAARRRIFVGEINHFDAMLAMQPRQFLRKLDRIAVPPGAPEYPLATIIAQVRTATRKLNHNGAMVAPIAVTSVVNQFPPNAVGI